MKRQGGIDFRGRHNGGSGPHPAGCVSAAIAASAIRGVVDVQPNKAIWKPGTGFRSVWVAPKAPNWCFHRGEKTIANTMLHDKRARYRNPVSRRPDQYPAKNI